MLLAMLRTDAAVRGRWPVPWPWGLGITLRTSSPSSSS